MPRTRKTKSLRITTAAQGEHTELTSNEQLRQETH